MSGGGTETPLYRTTTFLLWCSFLHYGRPEVEDKGNRLTVRHATCAGIVPGGLHITNPDMSCNMSTILNSHTRTNSMAIKVEKMTREFVFNGIKLPDPNPELTVEKVREIHAMTYPEISTAAVEGPEILGNRLRYTFSRAVEIRGAFAFFGGVPF